MYKRKFPKTRTVLENAASQLSKNSSNSPLNISTPSMSSISNLDEESPVSPSLLEEFNHFPVKKKALDRNEEDMTDTGSEPLFDDNDDQYLFLKQTLKSCGLHLKCDQNILCKYIRILFITVFIIVIQFLFFKTETIFNLGLLFSC